MTSQRYLQCLEILGWSFRELGRRIDAHEQRVRLWSTKPDNIPEHVAAWLETLTQAQESNPAPRWNALEPIAG